jgi:hypothetical protein
MNSLTSLIETRRTFEWKIVDVFFNCETTKIIDMFPSTDSAKS